MLQEDSNGENSFEIVEKKSEALSPASEKTESLSSVSSSQYSIPSPVTGNLLSNVPPPSSLPDFTIWSSATTPDSKPAPTAAPLNMPPKLENQFPVTQFSAAIPPNKGITHGSIPQTAPEESSGFMGIMKEAFASGGVLSKMAEKAKNSVDSIITTLDPQMSEYIHSSGDTELTVVCDNDEDFAVIRDAFHNSFGKAWINQNKLNLQQPNSVGFENAFKKLEEKLQQSLKTRKTITITEENFIYQIKSNWYSSTMLLLNDPEKNISIDISTQPSPIPSKEFLKRFDTENPESKNLKESEKLATYLKGKTGWEQGVLRKELLTLAVKSLSKIYKDRIIKN